MCLDICKIDNKVICKLNGDLNYFNISKIESKTIKISHDANIIVFDLKDVKSITSSFFRLCLDIVKIVGNDNFSVINIKDNEYLTQIFKISKFNKILNTDIID